MSAPRSRPRVPVVRAFLPVLIGLTVVVGVPWLIFAWIAVSSAVDGQVEQAAVLAAVLVVVAFVYVRIAWARLILEPDVLVVRNYWRTRRVARQDIVEFRVRGPRAATNTTKIVARLRDGRELRLNVGSLSYLLAGTRVLDRMTDTLMEWNATGTVASGH